MNVSIFDGFRWQCGETVTLRAAAVQHTEGPQEPWVVIQRSLVDCGTGMYRMYKVRVYLNAAQHIDRDCLESELVDYQAVVKGKVPLARQAQGPTDEQFRAAASAEMVLRQAEAAAAQRPFGSARFDGDRDNVRSAGREAS